MGQYFSPGLFQNEINKSTYTPAIATSIFGVVGAAAKGPFDTVMNIGTYEELIKTFGNPLVDDDGDIAYVFAQAMLASIYYLSKGAQLRFVRVGDGTQANAVLQLKDGSAVNAAKIYALYAGTWGDSLAVTVSDDTTGSRIVIYENDGVKYNPVETYRMVTKTNIEELIGTEDHPVSDYVYASKDAEFTALAEVDEPADLAGGKDGVTDFDDFEEALYDETSPELGIFAFEDPEKVDVDRICCPGFSSVDSGGAKTSLIAKLTEVCASRGDCGFYLDPPATADRDAALTWCNTTLEADTDLGVTGWPWHLFYDPANKIERLCAPSGVKAALSAASDYSTEVWYPYAGMNRGKCELSFNIGYVDEDDNTLFIPYNPSSRRDLNLLLDGGGTIKNRINPFVRKIGKGIFLWGNKTLTTVASALDRDPIRKLMGYLKRMVKPQLEYLIFEPHNQALRNEFVRIVEAVLQPVKDRGGVYDFKVICDDSVNTDEAVDNNELRGKILIKPTKFAEKIIVDWVLTSSGVKFENVS